jgi:hypothetical protein
VSRGERKYEEGRNNGKNVYGAIGQKVRLSLAAFRFSSTKQL